MEFNVEKCKVMHIGGTNRNYRYPMDQKKLEVVEEDKDLGVLITNDLKVSQQCTAACDCQPTKDGRTGLSEAKHF